MFTKREICDTTTHTEGLFALSCEQRFDHRFRGPGHRGCAAVCAAA